MELFFTHHKGLPILEEGVSPIFVIDKGIFISRNTKGMCPYLYQLYWCTFGPVFLISPFPFPLLNSILFHSFLLLLLLLFIVHGQYCCCCCCCWYCMLFLLLTTAAEDIAVPVATAEAPSPLPSSSNNMIIMLNYTKLSKISRYIYHFMVQSLTATATIALLWSIVDF